MITLRQGIDKISKAVIFKDSVTFRSHEIHVTFHYLCFISEDKLNPNNYFHSCSKLNVLNNSEMLNYRCQECG